METYQNQTMSSRQRVNSSSLASIGYDPVSWTLDVEFRKGGVYRYSGVLPQVYQMLMLAPSKGRFFIAQIRDRFLYSRVC